MAFTVSIEIKKQFDVQCSPDKVHEILSDVPRSVSHFPKVEELVDLGDNSYRWEMEKIGIDKYYIQTVYACKYTDNKKDGWVKWEPVSSVGNGIVRGEWNFSGDDEGTRISFYTKGDLTLPLPGLVKFFLSPFVVREFESLVDKYIENLKRTFNE